MLAFDRGSRAEIALSPPRVKYLLELFKDVTMGFAQPGLTIHIEESLMSQGFRDGLRVLVRSFGGQLL